MITTDALDQYKVTTTDHLGETVYEWRLKTEDGKPLGTVYREKFAMDVLRQNRAWPSEPDDHLFFIMYRIARNPRTHQVQLMRAPDAATAIGRLKVFGHMPLQVRAVYQMDDQTEECKPLHELDVRKAVSAALSQNLDGPAVQ